MNIESFASQIPASLLDESGKVFYSGRDAFSRRSSLYILGINPGGAPISHVQETIRSDTRQVLAELPNNWSAYRDESWEGALPGAYGLQPRILHMFSRLGISLGHTPASNLIFVRSSREAHLKARLTELANMCWPFHQQVILELQPKVILCLGKTPGEYVCKKLGAQRRVGTFVEQNNRRWMSSAFENSAGVRVVIATHPSIADWRTPAADPTELVEASLK